ncbi:hypothetical protein FJY71_05705, partial [candidate division WOR-3 bacterium]|nr:hypothetical protein [candidate division WOR-3 bacterium]
LGSYDLDVTVMRQGAPVRDALVCAWKQGEFYVFGYTDASGNVTLAINATSPGNFSLTATGQGCVPHQGSILARTTGTPYVTYLRCFVNDSMPRGNGDGCINPGEQIILPTWVKNHGDSAGVGVTGTLRENDTYVTLTDSAKSFGTIPAHDSAYTGPGGFGFTVAAGCTNGHMVQFTLRCRDNRDSVWNSRIYLRVGAPYLVYANQTAVDTVMGGNRNGRIDPNEYSELYVGLRNTGYGHANAVTAVLRSGDVRFAIVDSTGAWGQIPAESTRLNGGNRFVVHALTMPMETEIPCTLFVSAQGGYSTTVPFTVVVGAIRAVDPIPDGPRTPPLYWAYDDVDTYYPEHPDFEWVEIRDRGTRLSLSDDQTVTISLPTGFGPWVYYGQSYSQLSICSNGWVAPGQTSTTTYNNTALPNSGMPPAIFVNWDDLYPPAGNGVWYYHDAANHRFIIEYDSVRYYSGTNYDKNEVIIYDTTVTFGDNEVAIQYLTANQTSSATVGLQDPTRAVAIQCLYDGAHHRGSAPVQAGRAVKFTTDDPYGIAEPGAGVSRLPDRVALRAAPSLFRSRATLSWQVPAAGPVRLLVYDVTGREVRTLVADNRAAGRYVTTWDGRDNDGRSVASGTYLCRLWTASGQLTARSVLVR